MEKIGEKQIPYITLFKDAVRYALSDWIAIFIFGSILLIVSNLENYVLVFHNDILSKRLILACVILVVLSIVESGYSYKIMEESINDSKRPPLFENYKEIFIHGMKDSLVSLFYISLIALTIYASISCYVIFKLPILSLAIITLGIGAIIILFMLGALLNLAYNEGNIHAAFDFKEIKKILINVGIFRLSIIYIFNLIAEYLILTSLFHIGIFSENSIQGFLINLIVTPFIVILTDRLFATSSL